MKKEILIFGSEGALGKGVSRVLQLKDYSKVHLYSTGITGDLSDENNVKKVFESLETSDNKLFFLFSTIGGYTGGKELAETSKEEFHNMMKVNCLISFLLIKHFALLMKKSAGGSILLTSAMTSLNAVEGSGAYGASKRALNSLVETAALEGGKYNFTANALAPSVIDTPANMTWYEGNRDALLKPEEIGEFIHNVFNNFSFLNGNIFKMPLRLPLNIQEIL